MVVFLLPSGSSTIGSTEATDIDGKTDERSTSERTGVQPGSDIDYPGYSGSDSTFQSYPLLGKEGPGRERERERERHAVRTDLVRAHTPTCRDR